MTFNSKVSEELNGRISCWNVTFYQTPNYLHWIRFTVMGRWSQHGYMLKIFFFIDKNTRFEYSNENDVIHYTLQLELWTCDPTNVALCYHWTQIHRPLIDFWLKTSIKQHGRHLETVKSIDTAIVGLSHSGYTTQRYAFCLQSRLHRLYLILKFW